MTKRAFGALVLCAVLGALALRTARLDVRPVHHDEANQAAKLGALLERGEYRYDPADHHGPTLYYLALPAARAAGARDLAGLDETALRIAPALAGTGVVVLFLLFAGGLTREARVAAAALAAVSPAMTYYSRFYIQEILLVLFLTALVAAGWRYARSRSGWWAAAAGLSAGLMFATKETSLVLFGGLAAALGLVFLTDRLGAPRRGTVSAQGGWSWRAAATKFWTAPHVALFLAFAAAAAALFFTSFFRNPQGLADAVRAVGAAFERAGHPGVHAQPWSFYLQTLAYSRGAAGPVWSEAFLLFLAVAGGIAACGRDSSPGESPRFLRFVLFFTVVTAAAYSLIPYKTPWNLLPFGLGLVLLAGHGAALLLRAGRSRLARALVLAALAPGFVHLAVQSYRASFVDHSSPDNPYAYAPTSPDLLRLVAEVEGAAAASPEGRDMLVEVIAPPDETWPLPWYFRRLGRVGYWTDPAAARRDVPAGWAGAVVASAAFADEVAEGLGEGYARTFYGLRPEVVLALFLPR